LDIDVGRSELPHSCESKNPTSVSKPLFLKGIPHIFVTRKFQNVNTIDTLQFFLVIPYYRPD